MLIPVVRDNPFRLVDPSRRASQDTKQRKAISESVFQCSNNFKYSLHQLKLYHKKSALKFSFTVNLLEGSFSQRSKLFKILHLNSAMIETFLLVHSDRTVWIGGHWDSISFVRRISFWINPRNSYDTNHMKKFWSPVQLAHNLFNLKLNDSGSDRPTQKNNHGNLFIELRGWHGEAWYKE